jgi:hypothetical protein
MPYVYRNLEGKVVERFAVLQPGHAEEFLEDDHPDLIRPPVVPRSVPMRQGREALIRRGLFDTVNNAINGMAGTAGQIARNEWEKSQVIMRDRPLTLQMGALLGLDAVGLDELFIYAATL